MTIQEIKEWRKTAPAEPDYGELEIIDTLLAEVDRLNDCKGCDLPSRINIATEALERIKDYDKSSKFGSGFCDYGCDTPDIARTALERIKG